MDSSSTPECIDIMETHAHLLMSSDASIKDQLRHQISNNLVDNDEMMCYFEKNGLQPVKERRKNAEKVIKRLHEKPERWTYVLLIKGKLIDEFINNLVARRVAMRIVAWNR